VIRLRFLGICESNDRFGRRERTSDRKGVGARRVLLISNGGVEDELIISLREVERQGCLTVLQNDLGRNAGFLR